MKKFYFFAIAAIGMVVGCQKQELKVDDAQIDDTGKVAVQFGIEAPSLVLTKSAVDAWDGNQQLYILGYERTTDSYLAEEALIYNVAADSPSSGLSGLLEVKQNTAAEGETVKMEPYYYGDGKVYDFYGYYVDDANVIPAAEEGGEATTNVLEATVDGASIAIVIDGTQDVMVAKADPEYDINAKVTAEQAYSAFAARREVHPTLTFNHMLSRFNFYVVAGSESGKNVVVKNITLDSETALTLNVAPTPGLVTTSATSAKSALALADLAEAGETPYYVENNNFVYDYDSVIENKNGKIGDCIMAYPGEEMHNVTITTELPNSNIDIDPLEIELYASSIVAKNGKAITKFEAGYQYDIILTIYGPEEVKITAVLKEWEEGGSTVVDPDKDIIEPTSISSELVAATTTTLSFSFYAPNGAAFSAGLSESEDVEPTTWSEPNLTAVKAMTGTVLFSNLDPEKTYHLWIKEAEKAAERVASAQPGDIAVNGSTYVYDKKSFNGLPVSYRESHPWDEGTPVSLPWLAVWFTPVKSLDVTVSNGAFTWNKSYTKETEFTLLTLNKEELEIEITAGTWTVELKSGETTRTVEIVVPETAPAFAVVKSYTVKNQQDFNSYLPASYVNAYPWDEATEPTLPWLCVETTPLTSAKVTVSQGNWSQVVEMKKADGSEFTLMTFSAEELGLAELSGAYDLKISANGTARTVNVTLE